MFSLLPSAQYDSASVASPAAFALDAVPVWGQMQKGDTGSAGAPTVRLFHGIGNVVPNVGVGILRTRGGSAQDRQEFERRRIAQQPEIGTSFAVHLSLTEMVVVVGVHLVFAVLQAFFAFWVALTPHKDRAFDLASTSVTLDR